MERKQKDQGAPSAQSKASHKQKQRKLRWKRCGANKCHCGLIHDLDADDVVATVHRVTEGGVWSDAGFRRHVSLVEQAPAFADLLNRLLAWDHLDGSADGPYWRQEIATALRGLVADAAEPQEKKIP